MKINDLEFRWTKNIITNEFYPEIVRWYQHEDEKRYCITLALWNKTLEGYEVKFISERPFEYIQNEYERKLNFWKILVYGQQIAQATFKINEEFSKEEPR